ncbi:Clp protease N-terminal domain-containing protein [Nocardiopsis sp. N85]|uniref:Clp protease N-terminal domain-containing protein n=1 Tax=Nocardiopsis sp. N85 TaxID=3029400 RepID=UPI00237FA08E|nr:Clp protease N-terminal domain-containing protein [Nocardiopsis sp. N85]MDE3722772.1 Clp protease N-terminal domain-containing protein [Nocardiopsis sp. N85]
MPKINVYLPEDLADAVRESGIPVSAVCQRALEQAVRRLLAAREAVRGPIRAEDLDALFPLFTAPARTVLRLAAARRDRDAHITTADLLAALVEQGGDLALQVLRAMEIDPSHITHVLTGRGAAEAPGPSAPPAFSAPATRALEATLGEATALGHNHVGCEHLLLGLVAEEEGAGGDVLRSLGAESRLTRRAVTAALAGYHSRSPRADPGPGAPADALDSRLAPLLARIERLEERLDARD